MSNMQSDICLSGNEKDHYYFLLLSTFFYLKTNNYDTTASKLFSEGNLANLFQFPQQIPDGMTPSQQMVKDYVMNFYANSYFNSIENFNIISYFWNQFWEILGEKLKLEKKCVSPIDKYLEKQKANLTLTCKYIYTYNLFL